MPDAKYAHCLPYFEHIAPLVDRHKQLAAWACDCRCAFVISVLEGALALPIKDAIKLARLRQVGRSHEEHGRKGNGIRLRQATSQHHSPTGAAGHCCCSLRKTGSTNSLMEGGPALFLVDVTKYVV